MTYTSLFAATALAALAVLSACSNDKEELLEPSSCVTANTSYSMHIQPVLQNSCYTCHSNAVADRFGRNVKLEGHANLQPWALNGQLVKVLQHAPGVPAMPVGGARLDDCTVARISAWAAAGAPNN